MSEATYYNVRHFDLFPLASDLVSHELIPMYVQSRRIWRKHLGWFERFQVLWQL